MSDRATCSSKARCCPNAPIRKIPRSVHERAEDVARALATMPAHTQLRKDRKTVEMLFAHLTRIMKLDILRRSALNGAGEAVVRAATTAELRRMASRPCAATPVISVGRKNTRHGLDEAEATSEAVERKNK